MDNPLSVLNCSEWLRTRGFKDNPFESGVWRAQDDKLLKKNDEVFYDSLGIDEIISENRPFILGLQGAGKTAAKHRIKINCEQSIQLPNSEGILAIDYDNHGYLNHSIDDHIDRIVRAINARLKNLVGKYSVKPDSLIQVTEINLDPQSKLIEINEKVRMLGFQRFLVLVDNIDANANEPFDDAYRKIEALATNSDILGLNLFRFFLPIRENTIKDIPIKLPRKRFPFRMIEWKKQELIDLYQKRLTACLIMDQKDSSLSNLGSFLCEDNLNDIDSRLVDFGLIYGTPRAIWMLGHYVIEKHFDQFPKRLAPANSRINIEVYNRAKEYTQTFLDDDNPASSSNGKEVLRLLEKELMSSLLGFEAMTNLQYRKLVVSSLSAEIRNNIILDQTPTLDIKSIIAACTGHLDGLDQLYDALVSHLGRSALGLDKFKELIDRHHKIER